MRALLLAGLGLLAACTNRLADDVPRLYACDRAEGLNACPGGWRCGLSGYCQDPAQPLPYACQTSDDCSAGWHCGAERLCYDRDAARDRACRAELEASPDTSDCAPGWRCGREARGQVCHPLDAGAAYLCADDRDCEATWRCGPERACVDVAAQGLRPSEVTFTTTKVSPVLPGELELLQLHLKEPFPFEGQNQLTFTAAGRLWHALDVQTAVVGEPPRLSSESTPLLRPAHALAQTEEHLLVTDSTGLMDYADALDGGTPSLLLPSLANAELRYAPPVLQFGSPLADEELAAFSGTTLGLCGHAFPTTACDPTNFQLGTLSATVNDVTFIEGQQRRRSALAATSAGPWFAPRVDNFFLSLDGGAATQPVWRPVALPGLSDGCGANPTSLDRLVYDEGTRMLAATTDGDRRLSVFKSTFTAPQPAACAALPFEPEYGPCVACGPGERLLQLGSQSASFDDHVLVAVCQSAAGDAGPSAVVSYRHHSLDGGCSLKPLDQPAAVRRGYHLSTATWGMAGVDAVGVPRACPLTGCSTVLYDSAPDRVAGGPARLAVFNEDLIQPDGMHQQRPFALSSLLGLRPAGPPPLFVAGSVVENPDWMISSTGSAFTTGEQSLVLKSLERTFVVPGGTPLALLNRSSDLVPGVSGGGLGLMNGSGVSAFSTITTDADGVPWLIVGAGDRIWAEPSQALSPDGGLRIMNIKAVPLPSADIQALAFVAHDRGDAGAGPILDGYTVEQQRLFRVVVHTPSLWLSEELRLGETTTVPVSVWMEGNRGRVGTTDGRVFGLPVPVAISTPIPEAPLPTVLNYGTLCGQAFALSPSALYRLTLETPPLGTWQRVSLESVLSGLDSFGPHWGAVVHKARVGNQEHLYLFSRTGLVVELQATCP